MSRSLNTSKGHHAAILRLGFPIAIGQLGIIVMGFADTMMVGHYNTPSLAAASFVNSVFNIVTYLLLGYSYGLTPLISALFGRGERREAGALFRQGLVCNVLYAVAILGLLTVGYFFIDCMGQPVELLPLIRPYYAVVLVSMFFVATFNALRQFTDGIGNTSIGMWALLVSNALNIVGNYVLIYGVGPFPELGLLGAGLSTLFARVVMVVIMVVALLTHGRYAAFRPGFFAAKARLERLRYVHRQSFPLSMQMGMESGAFAFSGIMAGWLGALDLAAYQVMITISTLGFMVYYSFASGMSIRIASFCGQGAFGEARAATRAGGHIIIVLTALVSLLFYTCDTWLVALFTSDVQVATMALGIIPFLLLYQLGDAGQICFSAALRGTSHVRSMMWTAFVSYVIINLPLGALLAFVVGMGINGLFLAFSAGLFVAAALYCWQYCKVMRRISA